MTGLVAPPPAADPVSASVEADGWYPPVSLQSVRDVIRLGEGVVTTARLRAALEGAIFSAMRPLTAWKLEQVASGRTMLSDLTDEQLAGRNLAELLWDRAVRYYAAAELADLHRDVSATDQGLDRAAEKTQTADDYRRLAYAAIADLQSIGLPAPVARNRVALV